MSRGIVKSSERASSRFIHQNVAEHRVSTEPRMSSQGGKNPCPLLFQPLQGSSDDLGDTALVLGSVRGDTGVHLHAIPPDDRL